MWDVPNHAPPREDQDRSGYFALNRARGRDAHLHHAGIEDDAVPSRDSFIAEVAAGELPAFRSKLRRPPVESVKKLRIAKRRRPFSAFTPESWKGTGAPVSALASTRWSAVTFAPSNFAG